MFLLPMAKAYNKHRDNFTKKIDLLASKFLQLAIIFVKLYSIKQTTIYKMANESTQDLVTLWELTIARAMVM